MTLVDSNVLIDVLVPSGRWQRWSRNALSTALDEGGAAINGIVYAELSAGFARVEPLEAALEYLTIDLLPIPRAALFMAGQQFRTYRRRTKKPRTSLLPDFLIGAHATVLGVPLITRDTRRYATYFPRLRLITP